MTKWNKHSLIIVYLCILFFTNISDVANSINVFEQNIIESTEKIKKNPQDANEYVTRAQNFFRLKQYEMAIADYTEAIKIEPQYVWAIVNRGRAYQKLENYDQAIADYSEAINLFPNDAALAYKLRGDAYTFLGNNELAAKDLEKYKMISSAPPPLYQNSIKGRILWMRWGRSIFLGILSLIFIITAVRKNAKKKNLKKNVMGRL